MAAATLDASTALAIIDVQRGMFMFERPLWRAGNILGRISGLLRGARQANACIVHVQHDGGPGHLLAKGSIGWPHRPEVAPVEGEITIEKHHSSAFHDTDPARSVAPGRGSSAGDRRHPDGVMRG